MHFTYQKLAMEILGFVNMNNTERITYAFNMRAPGGRYLFTPKHTDFENPASCLSVILVTSCQNTVVYVQVNIFV